MGQNSAFADYWEPYKTYESEGFYYEFIYDEPDDGIVYPEQGPPSTEIVITGVVDAYSWDASFPNTIKASFTVGYFDWDETGNEVWNEREQEFTLFVKAINGFSWKSSFRNMTRLTLPESLESIGERTFSGWSSLQSLFIPKNVRSIGNKAFVGCSKLSSIEVDAENQFYDSREGCNAIIHTAANTLITGCNNTSIPTSVTSIGNCAFNGSSEMKTFDIPESVTFIGESAFAGCGLTSVTIPAGLSYISDGTFADCKELTSIVIPNNVVGIGSGAFSGCTSLASISVPKDLAMIESSSFYGSTWYKNQPDGMVYLGNVLLGFKGNCPTDISIKEGTLGIAGGAFAANRELVSVSIPNSLEFIGYEAFNTNCEWYQSLPEGLNYLGKVAYLYKGKMPGNSIVKIKEGTKSISGNAFNCQSGMKSISIPKSVEIIGHGALSYCTELTSLDIPEGVSIIGDEPVVGCYKLKTISIPKNVVTIGHDLFRECSKLASITCKVPKPIYYVDDGYYETGALFNLTKLYVPLNCKTEYQSSPYWGKFKTIVEADLDNTIIPDDCFAIRSTYGTQAISLENKIEIVGVQFDLQLPNGVSLATNAQGKYVASLTNRSIDHSISVNKISNNTYRFVSVSMNNKAFAGTEGNIVTMRLNVDENVTIGNYDIKVLNTELTTVNKELINSIDGIATLTVKDADPGDVNGDMKVSVTDVSAIIGYILNDAPAIFIDSAADMNGDNKISVTDAVLVIDKILGQDNGAGSRATKEPH